MNRNKAKLISAIGFFVCLISAVLFVYGIARKTEFSPVILPVFFVGGFILIICSLAYYTEK